MKRFFIILVTIFLSSICLSQTLEEFFVLGAGEYVQLSKEQRKQLLNNSEKQNNRVQTIYQGEAKIVEYKKNNILRIKTSEQGNFSIKRWDLGEKGILFGISCWVCSPVCDGWIKFISPQEKLSLEFPSTKLAEFTHPDSLKSEGWDDETFEKKIEIPFYHYEFTEGDTIKVINNSPHFLSKERQQSLSKFWKQDEILYLLRDGKLKKIGL